MVFSSDTRLRTLSAILKTSACDIVIINLLHYWWNEKIQPAHRSNKRSTALITIDQAEQRKRFSDPTALMA
jgi:hypothetical protein